MLDSYFTCMAISAESVRGEIKMSSDFEHFRRLLKYPSMGLKVVDLIVMSTLRMMSPGCLMSCVGPECSCEIWTSNITQYHSNVAIY